MGKTKTKLIDDSKPVEASETLRVLEGAETSETKVKKLGIKIAKPIIEKSSDLLPKKDIKVEKVVKKVEVKIKPRSKKYQEVATLVDKEQKYPLKEAITIAQKVSYWKKPSTLEIHINTNVKSIRGLVALPFASGKKLTILAFGKGAKDAGAEIEGTEETLAEIEKGKINFDVVVATPEWMPKLAKSAKVLGPKGLMPNPKNETVTENLGKTIKELQSGKTEFKTEANGQVIHLGVGKVDQPVDELYANIKALYNSVGRSKITKITLSPTMGPGVKVNLSSI